jgi:hypothetical protein
MKIKITKCSHPERWYRNSIGKVFETAAINICILDNKKSIAEIIQPSIDYALFVEDGDFEIVAEKKLLIEPIKTDESINMFFRNKLNEIINIINEKLG